MCRRTRTARSPGYQGRDAGQSDREVQGGHERTGAGCGAEVCRSPAAVPSGGYLQARRHADSHIDAERLEIDNNVAENAIRPLALGRKNWLFAGSPKGGKACAIALSLLQSAKACGVNPYDYLHDIYNRTMSHSSHRLSELLPAAWNRTRQTD